MSKTFVFNDGKNIDELIRELLKTRVLEGKISQEESLKFLMNILANEHTKWLFGVGFEAGWFALENKYIRTVEEGQPVTQAEQNPPVQAKV